MKRIKNIQKWLSSPEIKIVNGTVLYDGDFYEVSVTISENNSSFETYIGLIHNRDFSFPNCGVNTCIVSGVLKNATNSEIYCAIEMLPKSREYSSFGLDNVKHEWFENFCFTKIKCITICKRTLLNK